MANLDVTVDRELQRKVRSLAIRHYRDASDTSVSWVANVALEIFLLFLDRVEGGVKEIAEPVTNWDSPTSRVAEEDADGIRQWLFRKG